MGYYLWFAVPGLKTFETAFQSTPSRRPEKEREEKKRLTDKGKRIQKKKTLPYLLLVHRPKPDYKPN